MPPPAEKADAPGPRREAAVTLGALRAFVEVVLQDSFSAAARKLGVSQPNISNQVGALEQALGVRLLHRRSPPLALTDAGQEVFVRARLALDKVAEITALAQDFQGLKDGRLRIGLSNPALAMRGVGLFKSTHPEIEIVTRDGNTERLRQELTECRIDVALCSLLAPDTHLASVRLAELDLQVLAPRDADGLPAGLSLEALAERPLIFREPGSVTRALAESALAQVAGWSGPTLTVTGSAAVKEAVAAGLGLAPMFRGEAAHDDRLRALDLDGGRHRAGFYALTLPENLQIPAVAAFLELLKTI